MDIAADLRTDTADSAEPAATPPVALNLPAELGIYAAADVYREMTGALGAMSANPQHDSLAIDAHRVEMVDASGVQLLLAFAAELHERGLSMQWIAPSRALRESVERLGVAGMLHLHADTPVA